MQRGYYRLSILSPFFILGLLFFSPLLSLSQGLINNGAQIVVSGSGQIYLNGGNWINNGTFSGATSTVTFGGSTAQSIEGSNATGFYNITASGGGTKTFNTVTSTVSNLVTMGTSTIMNANGKLTLLAASTTNANVAAIPSSSSITGNVNVQVYFTGNSTDTYRGTRAISSPVTNATYAQLKNYMIITGKNGGGFDLGGGAQPYGASLTNYKESVTLAAPSQFEPIENITDAIPPGHGTFLFFRGDRSGYTSGTASTSLKVNAPFAAPENVTAQYTGPINQQDISVTVARTNNNEVNHDGYKLIGNPYPAVINWASVTKSNMVNELKIIKPTGGFATYKDGVVAGTDGLVGNNIQYIMPGQAFYVRALAGGGSVTFTEGAKSFSDSPLRFMSSPKESPISLNSFSNVNPNSNTTFSNKELRIKLQNSTHIEEAVTVFRAGSSSASENDDAVLFGGSTIILSTLSSDNVKLTINFMPEIDEVKELKLSVNASATGPVKLNFTDLSAAENYDVVLVDNFLNTTTSVKSKPVYDFVIDKAVATSFGNERFKIVFKPLSTVVALAARKATNGAELTWSTIKGPNNGKFEVERSADGINYTSIGNVNYTPSTASYSFLDIKPAIGANYYRLKQTDTNGNTVTSTSAFLDYLLDDRLSFALYPNPTIDWFTIDLNKRDASLILSIHDLQGKELKRRTYQKDEPIKDNISSLIPGIYILQLKVESNDELIGTAKLIKE